MLSTTKALKKNADFFNNGFFLIKLSAFEKKNKILISGHRFIPFLNPALNPKQIAIKNEDGSLLPKKVYSAYPEVLKPLYSFFGDENFLFLLIDDQTENKEIIINSTKLYKLKFTAFSLANIPISESETIVLKIENMEKGIYSIEQNTPINTNEKWLPDLKKNFKERMKKNKSTIYQILSDAFLATGKWIMETPMVNPEEFFKMQELKSITNFLEEKDMRIGGKKLYLNEKIINLIKLFENDIIDEFADIFAENRLTETENTKVFLTNLLEKLENPSLQESELDKILEILSQIEMLIPKPD